MDDLENNNACVLKMKNLYFEKINFNRDIEFPTEIRTRFDTEFNSKDNDVEVKLICSVTTNKTASLDVVLVGIFENNESDTALREEITKVNAVAIMFPYLRAQLSLITAQPNFPTIDLPIININEFLNSKTEMVGRINK